MTQVLIVGAGPTGLTLAYALAKAGVRARIIDQASAANTDSRAVMLQSRVLESLDQALSMEILAESLELRQTDLRVGTRPAFTMGLGTPDLIYKYPVSIAQYRLTSILESGLARYGVRVEYETQLTGLLSGQVNVTAETNHGSISADFLVGADGANSKTRELSGIGKLSLGMVEQWIAADIKLQGESSLDPSIVRIALADGRLTNLMPIGRSGNWRVVRTSRTGDSADPNYWNEALQKDFGLEAAVAEVLWSSSYEVSEQLATRFVSGRVVLAGDAAHSHSPIGARGMNLGMLDALNLAWKLKLALEGFRGPLLESFEVERKPVAQRSMGVAGFTFRSVTAKSTVFNRLRDFGLKLSGKNTALQTLLKNSMQLTGLSYGEGTVNMGFIDSVNSPTLEEVPEPDAFRDITKNSGAGNAIRLRDERLRGLLGGGFTAVILNGESDSIDGNRRIAEAVDYLRPRGMLLVLIARQKNHQFDVETIEDPDFSLHKHFGAQTEGLVVIRPDAHIGFSSFPIDLDALVDWWELLLQGQD